MANSPLGGRVAVAIEYGTYTSVQFSRRFVESRNWAIVPQFCTAAAPMGQRFAEPWATPRDFGSRCLAIVGPMGQRFICENGWPVGRVEKSRRLVPLGVALVVIHKSTARDGEDVG